jgi:AraC-like DNA-binding protein
LNKEAAIKYPALMMHITGLGQILWWNGGTLWVGLLQQVSSRHNHHAIQIILGLEGPVGIGQDSDISCRDYAAVLIPPHVPHVLDSHQQYTASLYCDPDTRVGKALLARFCQKPEVVELDETIIAPYRSAFHRLYSLNAKGDEFRSLAIRTLTEMAGTEPLPQITDPRIEEATNLIGQHLDRPIELDDLAKMVGLSGSRFRHLFVAETGTPLRRYILWRRLNQALHLGLNGTSWTEAAHAVNFSDQAHLTRTFRDMLGISPSMLGRFASPSAIAALRPIGPLPEN